MQNKKYIQIICFCKNCNKQLEGRKRKWCSRLCYRRSSEFKRMWNAYMRKYNQRPEVKIYIKKVQRGYHQRPEVKKRIRELNQRPEVKKKKKEYYELPEVKKKIKQRQQRPEVKKRRKKYLGVYNKNNDNKIKARRKIYRGKRRKIDMGYVIKERLRTRLWISLKYYTQTGKVWNSRKYGIDFKAIIKFLEPFPEDISKYHVDHIKPLVSFDLTNPEEVKKAFAPENHQWLLASENISKGAKIHDHKLREEK